MAKIARPPTSRVAARGARSALWDVRCAAGPGDATYPERHGAFAIAFVRRGEFVYRAADESAAHVLGPGWLLLGRAGHEYECTHERCGGDDCTSLMLTDALIEDVARHAGGRANGVFFRSVHPPIPRVAARIHRAWRAIEERRDVDVDELAVEIAADVLRAQGGRFRASRRGVRDDERVRAAVHLLETRSGEGWSLGALADEVGASPFHFLRVFREAVGTTPHQYLVGARLRRAAALLLDTRRAVTDIAYDVGFQDLSNFVRTFHREIGQSPRAFRAGA